MITLRAVRTCDGKFFQLLALFLTTGDIKRRNFEEVGTREKIVVVNVYLL